MRAGLRLATGLLVLAACTPSNGSSRDDRISSAPPAAATLPATVEATGGAGAGATVGATSSKGLGTDPAASPAGAGGPTVETSRRVRTAAVARLRLPDGQRLTALALSQGRVAWSACRSCRGSEAIAGEVHVADTARAGSGRVVARASAGRTATVVALAGDVIVWLEAGTVAEQPWVLRLVDLRTGAGRALADGRALGTGARSPVVFVGGRTVTWQLYDLAAGRGPVVSQGVDDSRSRVVTADLPGQLRGVTPQGLVYTANDPAVPTVVANAPVPYDIYLLPPAGRPRNLTRGHAIAGAVATPDGVVWRVVTDDESLVYAAWPGGTPVRLFAGPVLAFGAGRGFGAWVTREQDPVVEVGNGSDVVTLPDAPPPDGGKLAVDGDAVAFVGAPDRGARASWLIVVRVVNGAR